MIELNLNYGLNEDEIAEVRDLVKLITEEDEKLNSHEMPEGGILCYGICTPACWAWALKNGRCGCDAYNMHLGGKPMRQYVIEGVARSKKNSQKLIVARGRPMILPSDAYKRYEAEAGQYLRDKPERPIDVPIQVTCVYLLPLNKDGSQPKRNIDLVNLLEATCDILVKHKIIADDNSNIVKSVDGSRVYYVAEEPKTYITITELNNESDSSE